MLLDCRSTVTQRKQKERREANTQYMSTNDNHDDIWIFFRDISNLSSHRHNAWLLFFWNETKLNSREASTVLVNIDKLFSLSHLDTLYAIHNKKLRDATEFQCGVEHKSDCLIWFRASKKGVRCGSTHSRNFHSEAIFVEWVNGLSKLKKCHEHCILCMRFLSLSNQSLTTWLRQTLWRKAIKVTLSEGWEAIGLLRVYHENRRKYN